MKNNKQTTLVSEFFRILGSDLHVAVNNQIFSLDGVGPFINAFSRHYALRTNKGNKALVLLNFTKFYVAYYLMHSSSFTRHLYANNVFVVCPAFTHVHLLKIICEVQARNKIVGFTRGQIEPTSDLSFITEYIRNMSHDSFLGYIKFTDFVNIVFSESDFDIFKSELLHHLESYRNDDSSFNTIDFIIESISLPKNFVLKQDTFPMFRGVLDFGVSLQLGIYRFRNTTEQLVFSTSQGSIAGLSNLSIELFANYLRIFNPTIAINNILSTNISTSDLQLDVSFAPLEEVWYQYMNVTTIIKSPKDDRNYGYNNKSKTTPDTIPDEKLLDGDSSVVASCYGGGVFIPIKIVNPSYSYVTYSLSDGISYFEDCYG